MKKVFKIILIVVLSLFVFLTFWFLWNKSQPKEIIYDIVTAEKKNIYKKTVATGKVEPRFEVLVKPQISGIISAILKETGEKVMVGEVIAQVKVVPDVANLNSAESRVNLAQLTMNKQQQEYDRQKKLFQSGVISTSEMETTEVEYQRSKEELQNATDNLEIVKLGISKKFSQYSNTQIRSTITGMILDIPIKVGNSVIQSNTFNDGTTIASVANMNDMIFKGKIDETEVGRVKEKMPMILTVGALQDKKFDAILEYIAPKGTEESGAVLFEIKAAVKIPDTVFIRAGYSANAEIVLDQRDSVLSIPENSVEFSNDSTFVYILKKETPKQEFERKPVKLGLSDGINVEVVEGLVSDEKVRGMVKIQ